MCPAPPPVEIHSRLRLGTTAAYRQRFLIGTRCLSKAAWATSREKCGVCLQRGSFASSMDAHGNPAEQVRK